MRVRYASIIRIGSCVLQLSHTPVRRLSNAKSVSTRQNTYRCARNWGSRKAAKEGEVGSGEWARAMWIWQLSNEGCRLSVQAGRSISGAAGLAEICPSLQKSHEQKNMAQVIPEPCRDLAFSELVT